MKMLFMSIFYGALLYSVPALSLVTMVGSACTMAPLSTISRIVQFQAVDDTSQNLNAFKQCGTNGSIELA